MRSRRTQDRPFKATPPHPHPYTLLLPIGHHFLEYQVTTKNNESIESIDQSIHEVKTLMVHSFLKTPPQNPAVLVPYAFWKNASYSNCHSPVGLCLDVFWTSVNLGTLWLILWDKLVCIFFKVTHSPSPSNLAFHSTLNSHLWQHPKVIYWQLPSCTKGTDWPFLSPRVSPLCLEYYRWYLGDKRVAR